MSRPVTRSTGHGQLEAGLPNVSKGHKVSLFKNVARDSSHRLVKRKPVAEEGEAQLPHSPRKVQRDSVPAPPPPRRAATKNVLAGSKAARLTAQLLGKRKRRDMVYNDIAIHEDTSATNATRGLQPPEYQVMTRGNSNVHFTAKIYDQEDESEDEVDETVAEDMNKLEEDFKGISQKYRLINRIGEGTFSTVYKAERLDISPDNDIENENPNSDYNPPPTKRRRYVNAQQCRIVALKKIYVTSSPGRILNELELLHELRNSPHICPLLTAFRHLDQVVAVLPYFRHLDFRLYYRDFITNDLRHYFLSLLSGLAYVHKAGIIHRDIKPTNFLYDTDTKQGVLVDFGLAERQGTDWQPCFCQEHKELRKERFLNSYAVQYLQNQPELATGGYPKQDSRPSRRANRAGTRGFRAPEVLLKCTAQTTKIDVWSAGVILLTLLGRRFPFFNSTDDIDAMIEIASIFGRKKMQGVAAMHGSVFETNIETIGEKGFTLEKIVLWASCREKPEESLHAGEQQAVDLLNGLLDLDPNKRLSARAGLEHEFFTNPIEDEAEREEREWQENAEKEQAKIQLEKRRRRAAKTRA